MPACLPVCVGRTAHARHEGTDALQCHPCHPSAAYSIEGFQFLFEAPALLLTTSMYTYAMYMSMWVS